MPYQGGKRRRSQYMWKRKRSVRRRPYGSYIHWNLATEKFLGIETKAFDQAIIGAAVNARTDATLGVINPSATITLSTVGRGDAPNQREGRRITFKSIYVSGVITIQPQINQIIGDAATNIYGCIVWNKQVNAVNMTSEQVFVNPGGSLFTATSLLRNLDLQDRFVVLKSFRRQVQPPRMAFDGTNIEQSGLTFKFAMYHKFTKPVTQLSTGIAGVGNINEIVDNSLNFLCFADNLDLLPLVSYCSRLRFVG